MTRWEQKYKSENLYEYVIMPIYIYKTLLKTVEEP